MKTSKDLQNYYNTPFAWVEYTLFQNNRELRNVKH